MSDLDRLERDGGAISRRAADAAHLPAFDDLARRGRRRRGTRVGGVVVVGVLAVAGVVGLAQQLDGRGGSEPQPVEPKPTVTSGPTAVPYLQDGTLHVGGASIPTRFEQARHAGGTTVVGSAHYESGSEWHLVEGDRLVPLITSDGLVDITVSPDGEVVLGVEHVSDDLRRLVMWDAASREVIGSADVPVEVTCCDAGGELFVHGVDLQHRAIYSTYEPWLWTTGREPVRVTGLEPVLLVSAPWPGGLMYQGSGSAGYKAPQGVYGTVTEDGRFEQVGTTPVDQGGVWSPDGESFVFQGYPHPGVQVQREGAVHELPMPEPGNWGLIAWESDTEVLAELRGKLLARCDVVALACVRLAQVPAPQTVWPG